MNYLTFIFTFLFSSCVLAQSMEFETPMFTPEEKGAQELGKSWTCSGPGPRRLTEKQEAICSYLNVAKRKLQKNEKLVSKKVPAEKKKLKQ